MLPLWLSGPIVAGLMWQRLPPGRRRGVAWAYGSAITVVSAGLFWVAVGQTVCASGPARSPGDWIVPSILMGLTVGIGVAVTSLLVVTVADNGKRRTAVIAGATAELLFVFGAFAMLAAASAGGVCAR